MSLRRDLAMAGVAAAVMSPFAAAVLALAVYEPSVPTPAYVAPSSSPVSSSSARPAHPVAARTAVVPTPARPTSTLAPVLVLVRVPVTPVPSTARTGPLSAVPTTEAPISTSSVVTATTDAPAPPTH